jgi:hypothetical protein
LKEKIRNKAESSVQRKVVVAKKKTKYSIHDVRVTKEELDAVIDVGDPQ